MERKAEFIRPTKNEVEESFLKEARKILPGLDTRRNLRQWINPSAPAFTAFPDAIIWKKGGVPWATVEVKEVLGDRLGIREEAAKDGSIIYTLAPGHEWFTQTAVQMLVLGVDLAFLVCWHRSQWKVARLTRREYFMKRITKNTEARYLCALRTNRETIEEVIPSLINKKTPGRRKKNKKSQRTVFATTASHVTVHNLLCNSQ